jgi:hypothetical protein
LKKLFYIFIVTVLFSLASNAQVKISGVLKNNAKELLSSASVSNITLKSGTFTDRLGKYAITAYVGDTLEFSYLGYVSYEYVVPDGGYVIEKNVTLSKKANILTGVKISGLTQYQKDSIARVKLYDDALGYTQETSIKSPISSLYQQFSKKYKDLRKFQEQFANMEQQKYIDTKYTYELVVSQTKLTGEEVAHFMNSNPLDYEYARVATDIELKMWIRNKYKKYIAEKEKLK